MSWLTLCNALATSKNISMVFRLLFKLYLQNLWLQQSSYLYHDFQKNLFIRIYETISIHTVYYSIIYTDNALFHTSAVAMVKIHELRLELLDHPPYSLDLAPNDFFLFPRLKIALGGQRFSSNEEAITFVNNYFAEKNAEYYLDGL